jgi:hypothetical protein
MFETFEDKLVALYWDKFCDARACGYSEAQAEDYATKAVNSAKNARRLSGESRK